MRPMPELKIVELPTSELVEYSRNSKLHPHEQIDQIANSISEFGNNDPIAVWHNENGEPEIVEGHGRLMALRKLGIETAPVIYLDHLTDEQRRAYAIVHNSTNMSSGFDMDKLDIELEGIVDIDMSQFDFDLGAIVDDFGIDFELPDGDGPEFKTVSLHMTQEQYELFQQMQDEVAVSGDDGNMPARQVCEVIRQWQAQRI